MSKIRFKADFTVEAEDIDEVKEQIANYLLGKENTLGPCVNKTDGWCMGYVKYWHIVKTCWGPPV